MKKLRSLFVSLTIFVTTSFLLLECGVGIWFQEVVQTSSVKNPKPVPVFAEPAKVQGTKYLNFFAVGDAGTGRAYQRNVAMAMGMRATEDSVAFVLFLGDNFYPSGVKSVHDGQWQEKFVLMYTHPRLQVPFYAVLGNHDYYSNPQAQVEYTQISTRWKMPARYYTFIHAVNDTSVVQFFCLDTTPLDRRREEENGKSLTDSVNYRVQLQWVEHHLQESKARWKIVIGHHALYSGGAHGDNPGIIRLLEPLFTKYKIDMYLAGHDHHLEMKNSIKGIYYIISGGGGTHRSVKWEDNSLFAHTNMGFVGLRLSYGEIVVKFYDMSGRLIFSNSIKK